MSKNIATADKEIQVILKKYNLKMGYEITFPIYNILPDEVQLALKVLAKHGMKIIFTLESLSKKN